VPFLPHLAWSRTAYLLLKILRMDYLSRLPFELRLQIIELLFAPCTLRRHIVECLSRQKLTPASGARDQLVRNMGIAMMDYFERRAYAWHRSQLLNVLLANKAVRDVTLAVERGWLRDPPMDITTLRQFCVHPSRHRKHIVIELFPKDDFIIPPPFINQGLSQHKRLTFQDRMEISYRLHHVDSAKGYLYHGIDRKVYRALLELWKAELPNLPRFVQTVDVIYKEPIPRLHMMFGPTVQLPGGTLRDLRVVLERVGSNAITGQGGRDVFGRLVK